MKVIAIGAGVSGLTLAAALIRFDPSVEVELYERDADAASRFQGYSLGLKGEGGLPVLRQLGLFEELRPYMQPITNFIFCDQQGHALLQLPSSGDDKHQTLRVKRSRLREVLRSAAPQVKINFGMQCTGYEQTADAIDVHFSNGQTVRADYVVATDGVGSTLRQQMVGDSKRYLGLTCIVSEAPIKVDDPLLAGGYCLMLGATGASAFCYRDEGGTHFSYTEHAESEDSLARQTPAQLVRRIQAATAGWHSPIPQIASAIDPSSIVVRGYYDKEPVKQVRDGRLWLIGDAAHPMSPFQGQGANMAMLDALRLAELLCGPGAPGSGSTVEAGHLEADIVARGRKAVTDSRNAARQFHTQSRFQQRNRNLGFRFANIFVSRFSKPPRSSRATA